MLTTHITRNRTRSSSWRALTLAAAVATLGLAACGADQSDDGSPTAGAPTAEAAKSSGAAASGVAGAGGAGSPSSEHDDSATSAAPQADSDGPLDVCSLISSEDVSAAFGVQFDHGTLTHHEQTGGNQCVWNGVDRMSVDIFSLAVQRQEDLPDKWADNHIDVERLFDESRNMADGTDLALGDKAYTTGPTIEVLVGDAIYSFMTVGDSSDDAAAVNTLATSLVESVSS